MFYENHRRPILRKLRGDFRWEVPSPCQRKYDLKRLGELNRQNLLSRKKTERSDRVDSHVVGKKKKV